MGFGDPDFGAIAVHAGTCQGPVPCTRAVSRPDRVTRSDCSQGLCALFFPLARFFLGGGVVREARKRPPAHPAVLGRSP